MYKIIQSSDFSTNHKYIQILENLSYNLNNKLVNVEKIKMLKEIIYKLDYYFEDIEVFFNINQNIVKRFIKNNEILNNVEPKFLLDQFTEKSGEDVDKFIKWLII
jgi:hypothetical protein